MKIEFFWFAAVVVEAALLVRSIRVTRVVTSGHFVMIYIVLSQAIFIVAATGALDQYFSRTSLASYHYGTSQTLVVYAVLFLGSLASLFGLRARKVSLGGALQADIARVQGRVGSWWVLAAIWIVVIGNIAFIDHAIAWENHEYLLMNSPLAYNLPARIAMTLRLLLGMAGIVGAFALPLLWRRRAALKFFMLLVPWVAIVAFQAAAHSRTAAIYVFVFCATGLFVAKRFFVLKAAISILLVTFLVVFALEGRAQSAHGMSVLLRGGFDLIASIRLDGLIETLINVLQGIFATGDSLLVHASHDYKYKILSISPLPSALDGFDAVLACCEIRVNPFVPMSAVAEAIHFGPFFAAGLLAFFILVLRWCAKVMVRSPGSGALFLNIYILVIFISANAYPLRNVFRQMLLVLFIAMALDARRKFVARKHGSP